MVLMCEGSEFQAEGPATQNALLASVVLVLSTTKSSRNAECKQSSLQVLRKSAKYESAKYEGEIVSHFVLHVLARPSSPI